MSQNIVTLRPPPRPFCGSCNNGGDTHQCFESGTHQQQQSSDVHNTTTSVNGSPTYVVDVIDFAKLPADGMCSASFTQTWKFEVPYNHDETTTTPNDITATVPNPIPPGIWDAAVDNGDFRPPPHHVDPSNPVPTPEVITYPGPENYEHSTAVSDMIMLTPPFEDPSECTCTTTIQTMNTPTTIKRTYIKGDFEEPDPDNLPDPLPTREDTYIVEISYYDAASTAFNADNYHIDGNGDVVHYPGIGCGRPNDPSADVNQDQPYRVPYGYVINTWDNREWHFAVNMRLKRCTDVIPMQFYLEFHDTVLPIMEEVNGALVEKTYPTGTDRQMIFVGSVNNVAVDACHRSVITYDDFVNRWRASEYCPRMYHINIWSRCKTNCDYHGTTILPINDRYENGNYPRIRVQSNACKSPLSARISCRTMENLCRYYIVKFSIRRNGTAPGNYRYTVISSSTTQPLGSSTAHPHMSEDSLIKLPRWTDAGPLVYDENTNPLPATYNGRTIKDTWLYAVPLLGNGGCDIDLPIDEEGIPLRFHVAPTTIPTPNTTNDGGLLQFGFTEGLPRMSARVLANARYLIFNDWSPVNNQDFLDFLHTHDHWTTFANNDGNATWSGIDNVRYEEGGPLVRPYHNNDTAVLPNSDPNVYDGTSQYFNATGTTNAKPTPPTDRAEDGTLDDNTLILCFDFSHQ